MPVVDNAEVVDGKPALISDTRFCTSCTVLVGAKNKSGKLGYHIFVNDATIFQICSN